MKILCVNSVLSDYGGAEAAAISLAHGLADRGHEIHFLAAQGQKFRLDGRGQDAATFGLKPHGKIHPHYREFPRIYPLGEKHGNLRKLLWHAQDVTHPSNEALFAEVLIQVKPNAVILHNLTGIGSNVWRTIRKSGIPCIQVIHDLGLICLNQGRFRAGRQCAGLCVPCRIQKLFRFSLIAGAANFGFVSPSHAILQEIERYVDLSAWRTEVISNVSAFRIKERLSSGAKNPRLLYVGRLEPFKGVDVMLQSAERARNTVEFEIDILGSGSLEQALRQKYAGKTWVRFHGSVNEETVAEYMSRATVLLVPSLWLENAPVVIVHALFANLPVVGSRIGGIPEYVTDRQTGRLLPPGDEDAWCAEIAQVVASREQVAAWSSACAVAAKRFDPQLVLDAYERLIEAMIVDSKLKGSKTPLN